MGLYLRHVEICCFTDNAIRKAEVLGARALDDSTLTFEIRPGDYKNVERFVEVLRARYNSLKYVANDKEVLSNVFICSDETGDKELAAFYDYCIDDEGFNDIIDCIENDCLYEMYDVPYDFDDLDEKIRIEYNK